MKCLSKVGLSVIHDADNDTYSTLGWDTATECGKDITHIYIPGTKGINKIFLCDEHKETFEKYKNQLLGHLEKVENLK